MSLTDKFDRIFYSDYTRNWDDIIFRDRILSHLDSSTDVLDLGAGAGIVQEMNFLGLARCVCGVDLDPRVVDNPHLDEGRIGDAGSIPYSDRSFDLVFADNVMEHLDEPEQVFAEIFRILRPGGRLLFKTPNRSHYMPLIARVTPHRFHQWINARRGRPTEDTFPTRYLANSFGQVQNLADRCGFELREIQLIEGRPEYLRMSWATYLPGIAYERIVNSSDIFAPLRILLIAELQRPTA